MNLMYELFPGRLVKEYGILGEEMSKIQEIRLRINRPVTVIMNGTEYYVSDNGQVSGNVKKGLRLEERDMKDIVDHICHSSLYAYEEEIKRGYITIKGGHRVGISGQVVLSTKNEIKTIKNISFINIRIAHEVIGVGHDFLPYLYEKERVHNTLIVSPPGFGKTTLLRDIIRCISDGNSFAKGKNCVVIDERSELAGSYNGIPQLDVGMRTDVMDSCPKEIGMMMAIRSMAPQVMAVDELGTTEDIKALFSVIRSGCSILATMHGESLSSVCNKNFLKEVMSEKVFSRYIVIKNRHHEIEIWDGDLSRC